MVSWSLARSAPGSLARVTAQRSSSSITCWTCCRRSGGVEFLVDDLGGAFEGDDFRGGDLERADALGDRRLGDIEVARGVGLGVAGVEVAVKGVGVELGVWHWMDLKLELKTEAHLSYGCGRVRRNSNVSSDLRRLST